MWIHVADRKLKTESYLKTRSLDQDPREDGTRIWIVFAGLLANDAALRALERPRRIAPAQNLLYMWNCGWVDVWMCGCVEVWVCAWMCGCVDIWIPDSVDLLPEGSGRLIAATLADRQHHGVPDASAEHVLQCTSG